jgi:hypothetical protein
MFVECATCPVRGLRCDGCVVTAMARLPIVAAPAGAGLPLDAAERKAVADFVRAGLLDAGYARSLRARSEPGSWGQQVSG